MDWTLIIVAIALIISVLSPIITSMLNHLHEKNMWALSSAAERKNIAISNYIQKAGLALKRDGNIYVKEYGEAYGEIFLYAPENLWEDIEKLDYYITNRQHDSTPNKLFIKICKELSKQ